MTRSVVALYNSRPEAEVARARLSSQYDADRVLILGRGDLDRLDQLGLGEEDEGLYRSALAEGSILLLADVDQAQDPERIAALLKQAAGGSSHASTAPGDPTNTKRTTASEEVHIPAVREELMIGKREVERGGARLRSFTRQEPVEEDVVLREEHLETETRQASRRLSLDQAEAAGLLKDRVVEVSAMREEPVILKEAVVREEIVLKKTVSERTERIRDTLRRTEVEVEKLAPHRD